MRRRALDWHLSMTFLDVSGPVEPKEQSTAVPALLVGRGQLWVVTERDLARALAEGGDPDTPVSQLATKVAGLVAVDPATSILQAAGLMLHPEVARLPFGGDELSLRGPGPGGGPRGQARPRVDKAGTR